MASPNYCPFLINGKLKAIALKPLTFGLKGIASLLKKFVFKSLLKTHRLYLRYPYLRLKKHE
jgi:hypothetical protein